MYHNDEYNQAASDSKGSDSTKATSSTQSGLLRCSYCGQKFEMATSPCKPFCSIRCQRIDLGNWLNESYGLPYEGEGQHEYREEDPDE